MRAPTRVVYRTCSLCEAHCGVAVEVDGDAVRTVRGDPDDALSRGYICPKAYGLKGLQDDPDRLRRRSSARAGASARRRWEEALELVGDAACARSATRTAPTRSRPTSATRTPTTIGAHPLRTVAAARARHASWRFSATERRPAPEDGLERRALRRARSRSRSPTSTTPTSCSCSARTRSRRTAA